MYSVFVYFLLRSKGAGAVFLHGDRSVLSTLSFLLGPNVTPTVTGTAGGCRLSHTESSGTFPLHHTLTQGHLPF